MLLKKFSTVALATMTLAVLGLQLPANAQSRPTREAAAAMKGRHSRERTHQCMDRRSRRWVHRRRAASSRGGDRPGCE